MRPFVVPSLALAALASSALATPRAAWAQGNDRSAPTGGRTALMGNAGVALSRDGAAPFLNPATIVRIDDQNLAFSVNFYTFSLTHYSDWHQPGTVDPRFGNVSLDGAGISTTRFTALPSTLCLFFTLAGILERIEGHAEVPEEPAWKRGRQKLAFCVGSTESEDVNLPALSFNGATPAGVTAQVQSFARRWGRLHVGPTYSALLTDELALGLSLHGAYSTTSFVLDSSAITSGTGATGSIPSSFGAGATGNSLDLVAILGTTYRLGSVTLGASLQAPSLHLRGTYDATMHDEFSSSNAGSATLASASGDFVAPPPVRLAVGAGAESRRLKAEIDLSYQFPRAQALVTNLTGVSTSVAGGAATATPIDAHYEVRSRPVWNVAAGAEYFVATGFSLVGGASTNISSLATPSPTMSLGNLVQARQHDVTLSFGVGSYGPAGDLLLGTQVGYGWGEALASNPYVLPNDWAVVSTQSYSVLFILAGATNLRAITRAVERVQNVVTKGTPDAPATTPPPAPTPIPPNNPPQ